MTDFLKSSRTPVIEYINLTTCLGDVFDILPQTLSFKINEDIYMPFLTGEILIEDSINLFEQFSISGNETICIKFYSYDYSSENNPCDFLFRTFDVLKVADIKQSSDYTKTYRLIFASQEYKKNETIKISKAYKYSTISNVIATIMTGNYDVTDEDPTGLDFPTDAMTETVTHSPYLRDDEIEVSYQKVDDNNSTELFIEKTKYIEPYITLPYMKPFDAIRYLSQRAIRLSGGRYGDENSGQSANFLFFENKRGFQFVSLDTLMENKENIVTEFVYGNKAQNSTFSERTVEREVVENLQILDGYDIIENINSGMYTSKLLTYDMLTGEMVETNYDYATEFYKTESLARNDNTLDYPPIFLDKDNINPLTTKYFSKYMFMPVSPTIGIDNITSDQTQRINDTKVNVQYSEYLQKRASQMSRLGNVRVGIEISGNSKHKVGDVVTLTLKYLPMNPNSTSNYAKLVKYYSGTYLITNIIHQVSRDNYKMIIELSKDSFTEKIGELE